jgi:hypothetical protein
VLHLHVPNLFLCPTCKPCVRCLLLSSTMLLPVSWLQHTGSAVLCWKPSMNPGLGGR